MDYLVGIAMVVMLFIACIHIVAQLSLEDKAQRWNPVAARYRSAGMQLICFTALAFVLFGSRMFLRPDVSIAYSDIEIGVYKNVTQNDKLQDVIETKTIAGCQVTLKKTYPLFVTIGSDTKEIKYKLPCDRLAPEMKTDIASVVSYLKEEK